MSDSEFLKKWLRSTLYDWELVTHFDTYLDGFSAYIEMFNFKLDRPDGSWYKVWLQNPVFTKPKDSDTMPAIPMSTSHSKLTNSIMSISLYVDVIYESFFSDGAFHERKVSTGVFMGKVPCMTGSMYAYHHDCPYQLRSEFVINGEC